MAEIITHNGQPALVIPDYQGDDWLYLFAVAQHAPLKVLLTKLDEAGEVLAEYTVEQQGDPDLAEWWTCECLDHHCRRKPVGEVCKHIEAIQDVAGLIFMFQTKEKANG